MEENIKILEEQLEYYKRHLENYEKEDCLTNVYYALKKYAQALENLIKRYKELEVIEKEHQKENGTLREKVKELEEKNEDLQKSVDQIYEAYQDAANKMFEYAEKYEKLEQENRHKIIGRIDSIKIEDLKDALNPYYVPKSKIKEKIEELSERNQTRFNKS